MDTTCKRALKMVSPGKYLQIQSFRVSLWFYCLLCYVMALACMALIIAFSCGLLRFAPWPILQWSMVTSGIWMFLFLPALIYLCFTVAEWCLARSTQIEKVLPLHSHWADRLSAPESLVRASIKTPVDAKTTLLRPAPPHTQTPAAQLVRPYSREQAAEVCDGARCPEVLT